MIKKCFSFISFGQLCSSLAGVAVLATFAVSIARADDEDRAHQGGRKIKHVLLISVDGMHAVDLAKYVVSHRDSQLAALTKSGVTYPLTFTSQPSDSFPGLLSIVTGGTPRSTGVYYDVSYDRKLVAPGQTTPTPAGTSVAYDESIDFDTSKLDGGGGIDPSKLPNNPEAGFTPVFPHQFLRVNTIFEVIHEEGLRTAWSDKHPAYDLVNGPSGKGVDDLYTPEINSTANASGQIWTDTEPLCKAYDTFKVNATINEINGKDHTGLKEVGTPAIFGMNFQAVSVGQKVVSGGYTDATGTPGPILADALDFIDQSLKKFVDALKQRGLYESTVIIVTAKHGQTPIERSKFQPTDDTPYTTLANSIKKDLIAQLTDDDVGLLWLSDSSKTVDLVQLLAANEVSLGLQEILAGDSLKVHFGDPATDNRVPDIVTLVNQGVVYTSQNFKKIAEHGGFSLDDTNVALLISNPRIHSKIVGGPVHTTQIAPTILELLGLDGDKLQAVQKEGTQPLGGLDF
jgi:Type I phosphodiesterase / nucleotide pyrophosphatase